MALMLRHKRAKKSAYKGTNSPDKGTNSSLERDNISDSYDDGELCCISCLMAYDPIQPTQTRSDGYTVKAFA